ncbi:MAG: hypothetical protein BWY82_02355 [Verrucomicrobia bacterium ADurb.Bin474]|nr:MAG: hypothetical protein BWY82_02355 [Verrucomicrobia bacterium ADurb.Bin474]
MLDNWAFAEGASRLKIGLERRLSDPPRESASRSGVTAFMTSSEATALAESWERDTLDFSPSIVILLNIKSGLRCTDSATLLFFTISTPSRSLTIASLSIALSSTDPPGWVG